MRHCIPFLALLVLGAGLLPAAEAKPKKGAGGGEGMAPAAIATNLAKVPEADPKAGTAVTVAKAYAGQHPRLLFTTAEIATLAELVAKDAVLKEVVADTLKAAGMFPAPKGKPDYVSDDTPALWKAGGIYPGLAYAWHLGKDAKTKQKIIELLTGMLAEPHWATGGELDSSMGAGNCMLMVGILFDAVAAELEPDLRAKMAAKMLVQARRMYYLGHKQLLTSDKPKFWQQDPLNNHRWHRNAGLAACLLAIADEPGLDTGYMLEQLRKELDYVFTWLPPDGDNHEGAGYQGFGFMHLALTARMADRVLGTDYQKHSSLRNAWRQQIYYWAPGRTGNFSFGDDQNGSGGGFDHKDAPFFIGPQLSRDPLAQAALVFHMQTLRGLKPEASLPWTMLPFYDATLSGGDHLKLPTNHVFADLGAVSLRDSWKPEAVAFSFKCGPYGGVKLNDFAWSTGKQTYINVAHDDPDQNGFSLATAGGFVFHPGTYSMPKSTAHASTILVDGKGQLGEGGGYTQPIRSADMRTLAYLTGWKEGEAGRVIAEGECGKVYKDLTRFRRSVVWLPGDYILLLDDVAAEKPAAIAWHAVTDQGQLADAASGTGTAADKAGKPVAFQVVADSAVKATVKPDKMVGRRGEVPIDRFDFAANAAAVRFACVIDPWGRKTAVAIAAAGDTATVTVTLGGAADTWTWKRPADAKSPSVISGQRGGTALIALGGKDLPPAVK